MIGICKERGPLVIWKREIEAGNWRSPYNSNNKLPGMIWETVHKSGRLDFRTQVEDLNSG